MIEKHALGFDPGDGNRFSEKIIPINAAPSGKRAKPLMPVALDQIRGSP